MKRLATLVVLAGSATLALADRPPEPKPEPAPVMKMPPPPAAAACFELSADGKLWSKTPELLCVGAGDKNVEIKLTTGIPATEVAVFHLDLKSRVRCLDCNKDVFALTNPSNSVLNALAITFDGKRDAKAAQETGKISIGKTSWFYRRK